MSLRAKRSAKANKTTAEKPARRPRTERNVSADVASLADELSAGDRKKLVALRDFLDTLINRNHTEDLSDIEKGTSVRKTRGKKAAAPEMDFTFDGIIEYIENLEIEPVEGGVRDLKPQVEAWGADWELLTGDAESRAEKCQEAGTFLAAMDHVVKLLSKAPDDELEALCEDLDVEPSTRKSKTAKDIMIAINNLTGEEDEEEDEESDEEEEDEEDEEEEGEEEEEDEDEDEESDEDEDEEEEEEEEESDEDDEDAELEDIDSDDEDIDLEDLEDDVN